MQHLKHRFACPPLILWFGMMCLAPVVAQAALVTITIKGTLSSGTDVAGVFGFPPGTDLTGQNFIVTFTFDDTKGVDTVMDCAARVPYSSQISHGFLPGPDLGNPGTAVLQIGSGAWPFGLPTSVAPVSRAYVEIPSACNTAFTPSEAIYLVQDQNDLVQVGVVPALGSPPLTTNYSWENPFSNSQISASPAIENVFILFSGGFGEFGVFAPTSITVTGALPPQLVGSIGTGHGQDQTPDQTTAVSGSVTAHIPLGADFQLGLLNSSAQPVQASYVLTGATLTGSIDANALFPGTVAFQYSDRPPNNTDRGWFQAVHEGTVQLRITPTVVAANIGAVTLSVVVEDPASLGSVHPEVDGLIYTVGNKFGIPPQYLKAQVEQESTGNFNPLAYRYEPLSTDYGIVSLGQDLRINNPIFVANRFATVSDDVILDPDGPLTQGIDVRAEDLSTRAQYEQCCGATPTVLAIVRAKNPTQHYNRYNPNYQEFVNGTTNFTAQTSLAASYGFMQMMYITAITELHWPGTSAGKHNPTYLYDTSDNVSIGGGSMTLGGAKVAKDFAGEEGGTGALLTFLNPDALLQAFKDAWGDYNSSAAYPARVSAKVSKYIPTASNPIWTQ